eukprot:8736167-Alexandrium_andersonii.AAC.1
MHAPSLTASACGGVCPTAAPFCCMRLHPRRICADSDLLAHSHAALSTGGTGSALHFSLVRDVFAAHNAV